MMTLRNSASKLALVVVLALTGCVTKPQKPIEITIPPAYSDKIPIPKVEPTQLVDVNWKVMNQQELAKFLEDNKGKDFVIYALDETNNVNLVGNIQELNRYIKSQQEVINYLIKIIDARTQK